jgi:hypothetical protein
MADPYVWHSVEDLIGQAPDAWWIVGEVRRPMRRVSLEQLREDHRRRPGYGVPSCFSDEGGRREYWPWPIVGHEERFAAGSTVAHAILNPNPEPEVK